jgi:hypothetical protein
VPGLKSVFEKAEAKYTKVFCNCPGSRREAKASGGKACFFEKKQQKTFGRFAFGAAGDAQPRGSKVFCFFFSEKKSFFAFLGPTA